MDQGLAAKGYRYINIDDGWWLQRRLSDGTLIIRTERFPSTQQSNGTPSFRSFTDRLHAMGLRPASTPTSAATAARRPTSPDDTDLPKGSVLEREVGLYGHTQQDIALYFETWGFDYIKVDGCGLRAFGADAEKVRSGKYRELKPVLDMDSVARSDIVAAAAVPRHPQRPGQKQPGRRLRALAVRLGRRQCARLGQGLWQPLAHQRRHHAELEPHADQLRQRGQARLLRAPGSWNDPDMLFIGKGEFDAKHLTEARSHFSLWAMLNAPLFIGMDMRKAPESLVELLGNRELIALNQDAAGHQATLAYDSHDVQILVKTFEQRRQGRGHLQPHRRAGGRGAANRAPQTARRCRRGTAGPVERPATPPARPDEAQAGGARDPGLQGPRHARAGRRALPPSSPATSTRPWTAWCSPCPTRCTARPRAGRARGSGERPIYAGWGGVTSRQCALWRGRCR